MSSKQSAQLKVVQDGKATRDPVIEKLTRIRHFVLIEEFPGEHGPDHGPILVGAGQTCGDQSIEIVMQATDDEGGTYTRHFHLIEDEDGVLAVKD